MNQINPLTEILISRQPKYENHSIKVFSPSIERIITEIAKEKDLSIVEIRRILDSCFRFTSKVINLESKKNKELHTIQWIYFGTFRGSKGRIKRLKKYLTLSKKIYNVNN